MTTSTRRSTGFTRQLADWLASRPRSHSPQAIDTAERVVVDTVACMAAGMRDEAAVRLMQGLAHWGRQGQASVIGGNEPLDAPWAALVNGTAAHALDYDDVLDPAASHVSAVLVPALLALAEECKADGAALVDAYICGVDVQMCLARAVNMAHYTQGWHTTSTLGAPAAAAACARLLGLDARACLHALSIATSLSGGFKRQFGTHAKPLHAGLAAKHGIMAARIAQAGLTADAEPFEGARGFHDLMASQAPGFAGALRGIEDGPAVLAPGVWQKRYPCCASTHRAVDAVRALMREHGLGPADIVGIETSVSEPAVRNLMYDRPENPMQARFSMPYCVAAAVIDGDLGLSVFTPAALARADLAAFLPKVRMVSDPAQPADMPATVISWADVTVATRTASYSRRITIPKGYPGNPLSEPELEAKFQDCLAFSDARLPDLSYAAWRRIGSASDVAGACRGLRAPAAGPRP